MILLSLLPLKFVADEFAKVRDQKALEQKKANQEHSLVVERAKSVKASFAVSLGDDDAGEDVFTIEPYSNLEFAAGTLSVLIREAKNAGGSRSAKPTTFLKFFCGQKEDVTHTVKQDPNPLFMKSFDCHISVRAGLSIYCESHWNNSLPRKFDLSCGWTTRLPGITGPLNGVL